MDAEETPGLAARLDHLFRAVRPPGLTREYTYKEVAEAIARAGGPVVSESYLYQMRIGRRDNPGLKLMEALASFFGTDLAYFSSREEVSLGDPAELAKAALLRDDAVMDIAMRSAGVPHSDLRYIATLLDQVRALRGLSDEAKPPLREWGVEPPDLTGD